jgi:predicted nucleic acid-binding protein
MMATLIDSSVWIDFTRTRSPRSLKQFIAPYILAPGASLAEPVVFEVLRHASDKESAQIGAQFDTLPMLPTPADLWSKAAKLGQGCRKKGIDSGGLDLLISAVAIHHETELVTFDHGFEKIASASTLKVKLLVRPRP